MDVNMVAVEQTAKNLFSNLLLDYQNSNIRVTEEEKEEIYDKILSDIFCDAFMDCVEEEDEYIEPSYFGGNSSKTELEYNPFG